MRVPRSKNCVLIVVPIHVETVVLLSHKKPDSHINLKVEFGNEEGHISLEKISK